MQLDSQISTLYCRILVSLFAPEIKNDIVLQSRPEFFWCTLYFTCLHFNGHIPDERGSPIVPRFSFFICSGGESLEIRSSGPSCYGSNDLHFIQPSVSRALKESQSTDAQPMAWPHPFSIHHRTSDGCPWMLPGSLTL